VIIDPRDGTHTGELQYVLVNRIARRASPSMLGAFTTEFP
jgi:hypothetical protein